MCNIDRKTILTSSEPKQLVCTQIAQKYAQQKEVSAPKEI